MGYACPVCEDPQADAGHLANHLAFTALLGDDPHESWLDEHATGWGEMGEADLADVVVEEVEETEFPQVFEDTVGGLESSTPDSLEERSGALFEEEGHGHDHADGHDHSHDPPHGHDHTDGHDRGRSRSTASPDRGPADADTEAILEEAREMTREMLEEDDPGGDGGDGQDGDTGANADGQDGDTEMDAETNAKTSGETNADADAGADENG